MSSYRATSQSPNIIAGEYFGFEHRSVYFQRTGMGIYTVVPRHLMLHVFYSQRDFFVVALPISVMFLQ